MDQLTSGLLMVVYSLVTLYFENSHSLLPLPVVVFSIRDLMNCEHMNIVIVGNSTCKDLGFDSHYQSCEKV